MSVSEAVQPDTVVASFQYVAQHTVSRFSSLSAVPRDNGIITGQYRLQKKERVHLLTGEATTLHLLLLIVHTGKVTWERNNEQVLVSVSAGECAVFFEKNIISLGGSSDKTSFCTVLQLSLVALPHLYPVTFSLVQQLQAVVPSTDLLPVSAAMEFILADMQQAPAFKNQAQSYTAVKVTELLLHLTKQLEENSIPFTAAKELLTQEELQRVMAAKAIITNDLAIHIPIVELARQVGTNESYLKKHFKIVTGQTIYSFLLEKRMKKARLLLTQEQVSLQEVSKLTGYKRKHHFLDAFKRYFDIAPSSLKKLIVFPWYAADFFTCMDAGVLCI